MKKEILTILFEVLSAVVIIVLPWLSKKAISFIDAKTDKARSETITAEEARILDSIEQAVYESVVFVNQTLVDAFKKDGEFDEAKQKLALTTALDNIQLILAEEAKDFLQDNYKDVEAWLISKIEVAVNQNKK